MRASNMDNANSREYLERIKYQVIENIKQSAHAPSVQQTDIPRDPDGLDDEADAMLDDLDDDMNQDERMTERRWDKHTSKDGELYDSDEADTFAEQNGTRRSERRKVGIQDYQNPHAVPDIPSRQLSQAPSVGGNDGANDENFASTNGANNENIIPTNGAAAHASPSPAPSDAEPAPKDEDVEMGDGSAAAPATVVAATATADDDETPKQNATPPASPPNPPAPATADQAMPDAAVAAAAQEVGTRESQEDNAAAERATAVTKEEDVA